MSLSANENIVESLALRADVSTLAEELGLRVVARGTRNPKALCPFHDDHTPSLVFYPGDDTRRGRYHCFACGAHGDIFGLVMRLRECDFRAALHWLANRYQQPLPVRVGRPHRDLRAEGLEKAFRAFEKQSDVEKAMLRDFATSRHFDEKWLREAEVFAARGGKLIRDHYADERETAEALREAGVVRRGELSANTQGVPLALDLPWQDFFIQDRVIFTLRDDRGRVSGFAGRSLSKNDSPKYLYTRGFATSETLYRFDRVRSALLKGEKSTADADLFVVEGLVDALRLESLGMAAVAVFGSQVSPGQARLLIRLADELDRDGRCLALHLFFDSDPPGRAGLRRTLSRLLSIFTQDNAPPCMIDIIAPPLAAEKTDPDSLLRNSESYEEARRRLSGWNAGALEWMLADGLGISTEQLSVEWPRLASSRLQRVYRVIERLLPPGRWPQALTRFSLHERFLLPSISRSPDWSRGLEDFLRARHSDVPLEQSLAPHRSDTNKLQHAMRVARASTQRRELPVDEGSWVRLEAAIEIAIPALCEQLGRGAGPDEPFVATLLPRSDGHFRPKALPSPETLTMQQYVLNELLRDSPATPLFAQAIPAVRFLPGRERSHPWTTGFGTSGETVAFAYQLDMDAIEGRRVPDREGMFRPYAPCWIEFVSAIDRRTSECRAALFHVARLDIRRYYCTLPRSAVIAALLEPLRSALHAVAAVDDVQGAAACVPLFEPTVKNPEARAQRLVDWLCNQSFDFEKEDPATGEIIRQRQGVPQGPDLSAYLANVALFPLDQTLQKLVAGLDAQAVKDHGEGARGAVYARYVDDIVLVATTPHDLSRMRAAVENGLSTLGLTINPKDDPLPAMSYGELREWLTEKRGLALGASGPFAGPPSVEPLSAWEPLVDAGEIDRRDSLELLHSPRFTDPDTAPLEIEEAVRIARRGDGLRHGDNARAAHGLWICAAQNVEGHQQDVAGRFLALWEQTTPVKTAVFPDSEKRLHGVPELLAWLDGLERLLCARPERNPSLSAEQQVRAVQTRETVARCTHGGLCSALAKRCAKNEQDSHAHMLRLRGMAILRAALVLLPELAVPPWFKSQAEQQAFFTPAECRLFISIVEAGGDPELLTRARLHPGTPFLWLLLHEATARLFLATRTGAPPRLIHNEPVKEHLDPLEALRERVTAASRLGRDKFLIAALEFLAPDYPLTVALGTNAAQAAARMLSTLAPTWLAELFRKRQPLTEAVLGQNGTWTGIAIATPPGLQVPGLLGVKDGGDEAVRVDFKTGLDHSSLCPTLAWKEGELLGGNALRACEANLGNRELIKPREAGTLFTATQLPRLARAFRCLAKPSPSTAGSACPVTPVNLLGPDLDDPAADDPSAVWEPLGYTVSLEDSRGHAFVRRGSGLVIEWVAQRHDALWRAGTALADLLGRGDQSRSLSIQRLAESSNRREPGSDWAVEAMLRYCLTRLRGIAFPSRAQIAAGQDFPQSIERVLRRMENFPAGSDRNPARLAHLFATLAEGRALHASGNCEGYDWSAAGGPAALLADFAPAFFRVDEELAHQLPHLSEGSEIHPKRRTALAWFRIAGRLDLLAEADPHRVDDPTLMCVAASARLLALQAEIRAQSLELWSCLDETARERLRQKPPNPGDAWQIDAGALFHRGQSSSGEHARSDANTVFLFDTLATATEKGATYPFSRLDGITPLGWLVILGALTSAFRDSARAGAGARHAEKLPPLHRGLGELAIVLAANGDNAADPPWDWVAPIALRFGAKQLRSALVTLTELDSAMGVEVTSKESRFFRLSSEPRRGVVQYSSESGSYELPAWQVQFASLRGERGNFIEHRNVKGELISRFVEARSDGRLIGVSVIQPHLAALADLDSFSEPPTAAPTALEGELELRTAPPAKPALQSPPTQAPPVALDPTLPVTAPPEVPPILLSGSPPLSAPPNIVRIEIERLQEASWSTRPEKVPRHSRVAFFQWDVDESYRHPLFEACHVDQPDAPDPKEPDNWQRHDQVASCAEERRRDLLTAALRACKHFNVDILLLPEYSIRPDTARWLREVLSNLAPKTSVWAGTYRVPSQCEVDVTGDQAIPEAGSAVMPVLLQDGKQKLQVELRRKKYPSVAVGEIIRPTLETLRPVFRPTSPSFDPRSFVTELICSEVFLVTSPANLPGMAHALRDVEQRFRAIDPPLTNQGLQAHIAKDILSFGTHCSLSTAPDNPRLILLVPAMTNRTVDYSSLGQAGFLASAITTVFCNAVANDSRGESCIIGHGGWGEESAVLPGLPRPGPYHGALPGIYQPTAAKNVFNSGRLGREEQALVIADIDPVYAPEGKPRPQMLPPPLRLVAHLPVIECTEDSALGNFHAHCRCQGVLPGTSDVVKLAKEILLLAKTGSTAGWRTTEFDKDPAKTAGLLGDLAKLPGKESDEGSWLLVRQDFYRREHAANPQSWPPPAALDWLWVERRRKGEGPAKIDVPPYTRL